MSVIKKLVSQTAVYGLSSIFGRFLNYLLVPLVTYHFTAAQYGVVSEFYAYAGFFSVFLLCGFETGYFRFRDKENTGKDKAYSTALIFVLLVNVGFFLAILAINSRLSPALHYADHPEYVLYFTVILILDAIAAIPFARLRAENKAFRFAAIKIFEIAVTVILTLFFIVYWPKLAAAYPGFWLSRLYNPAIGISYVFIANLVASICKFGLLSPQLLGMRWGFDRALFSRMWRYSLPMVFIGFNGIINEMLDRVLLKHLLPYDTQTNLQMLGIYSACYKLSILMSLFIQAFRYAAEPFFFAYADKSDAKPVYARILKFFVMFCIAIFLLVTLYIDFFKYFLGKDFRSGLGVVPILLLANLFLGIYVNLSIWYKLTDKTGLGAVVAFMGAVLTVVFNILWIPQYGYVGSAYATLLCYFSMSAISYLLGQKHYPVNYDVVRLLIYIGLGIDLYLVQQLFLQEINWAPWRSATVLMSVYALVVLTFEVPSRKKHR